MNTFLKICAVILLVCSCGNKVQTSNLVIETENGDIVYHVELASEVKELEVGLMHRDKLAADGGMLFDLSKVPNKITAMWMKDTKLSLDMMFLTKEGVIYWIKENAQPYSEELIIAPFPAAAVLEVNAGDIAKHNIKIGERVKHSMFKPFTPQNNIEKSSATPQAKPETKAAETADNAVSGEVESSAAAAE